MKRYVAGIQYNGTAYSGWQRQKHATSVQEKIECAFSKIANEEISVFCAGRTDSGVHAFEQIIHFETTAIRDDYAWRMGCNSSLDKDVRVLWCTEIDEGFHARFSATSRQYRYIIHNSNSESALLNGYVNWIPYTLNVDEMHRAAQFLLGEQDFTSFRAAGCQSNSPFRQVLNVSVKREKQFVMIDIEANAFLHHMVRNIVGSLVEVGRENHPSSWIGELLKLQNRDKAGVTALACGLYFIKANYPNEYKLPQLNYNAESILTL